MARLLVQTTLPHSRQRSKTFVRTNGALKVSISAHPLLELPYGRYPRLLMAWVTTEAVRTREPVLQLGPSLSSFMSQLGLLPRGGQTGPIGRLRDQMQRLFGATIAFTWDKRTAGEWHDTGFRVSNETHLWWNPVRPEQTVSWRSSVSLSPGFFEAVCDRPVPIDLRVLRALRSPMAIDLYCLADLSQQLPEKALSDSLGRSCSAIRGRLPGPQGLQALFPRRTPPGSRSLPRRQSQAGTRWNPAQALTLPHPKTTRTVISACGKPGISTHKRYPSVRINATPLPYRDHA